jgi:lactase-phlorizin hydrolase
VDGETTWLDGDANIKLDYDPSWNTTATGWPITPFGLRKVITWISRQYNFPIYVTENGYGGWETDGVEDPIRVEFYRNYINNVLKSIKLDGSDVRGYAAWSLIDNFEWANGYT